MDEFNVITNTRGQMLVGQFGSFITQFLNMWKGTIEEGDVFVTNDVYQIDGAVSHLNDVIVLLPIFYKTKLIGNLFHSTRPGSKTDPFLLQAGVLILVT
jgi:5-oxoprolinase (ATP-hydrolysing)